MIQQYATLIATIIFVAVNGLWYAAKMFLNARGIPVRWFSRHFQDLTSLRELAERSLDRVEQGRARTLLWVLRGGMVMFLLVAVPLFLWGTMGRQR
jgi:hypothetical protein